MYQSTGCLKKNWLVRNLFEVSLYLILILFSLGPYCSQKARLTSEFIYLAWVLSSPQTPYQSLNIKPSNTNKENCRGNYNINIIVSNRSNLSVDQSIFPVYSWTEIAWEFLLFISNISWVVSTAVCPRMKLYHRPHCSIRFCEANVTVRRCHCLYRPCGDLVSLLD